MVFDGVEPAVVLTKRRRWLITAGLLLGIFLAALEATVVSTAMPTVVASLGGLDHYSWVFSAYLLTSTASVPLWGRLSDLYGRRRLYLAAIALFLVGSMLAGVSQSMPQLMVFRAVQGLGAGGLIPLALTIIGEIYTLAERTRMQAVFSSVWGVSSIAGPLVGGFITDAISWRWVFYLNLPIGLVAAVIVHRSLPEHASGGKIGNRLAGRPAVVPFDHAAPRRAVGSEPDLGRGRVDLHRRVGARRANGRQSDPAAGPLPKPHRDGGERGGISRRAWRSSARSRSSRC